MYFKLRKTLLSKIHLGNAENCVPLRVDGIFRVEFDGGILVGAERAAFSQPLDVGSGLAPEPQIVPDGAALLQRYVVHAVALQVRRY